MSDLELFSHLIRSHWQLRALDTPVSIGLVGDALVEALVSICADGEREATSRHRFVEAEEDVLKKSL